MTPFTGAIPAPKYDDAVRILVKIDRPDISVFASTVEAYETVALPRTIDPHAAIVILLTSPDFVEEAKKIVDSINRGMFPAEIISIDYPPFSAPAGYEKKGPDIP